MTKLSLRVVDRILLLGLLDKAAKSGQSLSQLSKLLKLHDKINFSDAERDDLNIRTEDKTIKWNFKKGGAEDGEIVDKDTEIELSDEQKKMVYDIFKEADEKKEFTVEGLTSILKIAEQVDYKVE